MNIVKKDVVAGEAVTFNFNWASCFKIAKAPADALLTVKYGPSGSLSEILVEGEPRNNLPKAVNTLSIESTVSGELVLLCGELPYSGGRKNEGGTTIPDPMPVIGTQTPGGQINADAVPDLVGVGIQTDNGDATVFVDPLQSFNRRDLLVGHVDDSYGFVQNVPSVNAVRQYATARISFAPVDGSEPFYIIDQFGAPMGYWEDDGTWHGDGAVAAGATFPCIFVPLVASTQMNFTAAGPQGWGLQICLSPVPFSL